MLARRAGFAHDEARASLQMSSPDSAAQEIHWKRISKIFTFFAAGIGAAALAGWLLDIDALKRIHPALVNMKPNTALCLMLGACSLLLLRDEPVSQAKRRVALGFATLITLTGLLTFSEHLFGWDLGIDQLLFDESTAEARQSFPGRMGVAAALSFIFLGLALCLLDARPFGQEWLAHGLVLATTAVTLLAFFYYFYGVEEFVPIAMYASIALHTVVALLCLCAGILFATPAHGFMAILLEDSAGSIVARRMLPFALLLPVLLGWLRVLGQKAGLYGTGFGSAIFAASLEFLLVALIGWTAAALNRAARATQRAERAMRAGIVLPGLPAARPTPPWIAYGTILLSVALITGVRLALVPVLGKDARLTIFLIPVMVSAYLGGLWPGLVATVISALVGNYLFHEPYFTFSIPTLPDGIRLVIFSVVGVIMSALSEALHRSRLQTAIDTASVAQAQQRLVTTLQGISDGFQVIDAQSRFAYFNNAAKRIYAEHGLEAESLLGRQVLKEVFPEAESEAGRALRRTLNERVSTAVEVYHEPWQRWLSVRNFPTSDGGVSTFFQDISERKRTEEALRASEERYRSLVSVITDVPWTTNAEGAFTTLQPAWEQYTGQSWEEYRGIGWLQATHPEDRQALLANGERARRERQAYEFHGRLWHAPTQSYHYFLAHAAPLLNTDGHLREWVGTCTDIHEQKTGEIQLRENAAILRTVTSQARVGLVLINRERKYVFANKTYSEILGLPDATLLGRGMSEVLAAAYDQIQPHLDRAFAGERVSYELRLPASSGHTDEHYYEVVYEPRVVDVPEPYVVVVIIEVTERKKMQQTLEKLVEERTARLRESVEELEAFSYSIAHDLRAPLRAMLGFSDILLAEHAPSLGPEGQGFLRRIAAAAGRMDNLIQDVLNYSRVVRADLPLERVDVEQLLRGILDTYPMLAPQKADIVLKGDFPVVLGNEAMLTQIFSNLLGNAVKFVGPNVRPCVRVWAEAISPGDPSSGHQAEHLAGAHRQMVRIFFQDNGIGIAPDQHQKIFEIFQRVEKSYEGTGIGLAIVRRAVERMNGKVGVQSELGQGSTFWVDLHQAEAKLSETMLKST